ncbi:MAG: PA2779 family protein [bacterium]|jgi:hypothetical protein
MNRLLTNPAVRTICWYLILVFSGFLSLPSVAYAGFITPTHEDLVVWAGDTSSLQEDLENSLLGERLMELGLTTEEIEVRLLNMTPEERRAVLADIETIQGGGDGVGTLISLAILALLVVLILKLLDKEIVIK